MKIPGIDGPMRPRFRFLFYLFPLLALLTSCSGWVEMQQFIVQQPPAQFNATRTIESIGYRLVRTNKDEFTRGTTTGVFHRTRSPEVKATTYPDGSITLLVWDSGVPPFEQPRGLDRAANELTAALRADGIPADDIRVSTGHSPPGRVIH